MPRQPPASIISITILCIVAQLTDCTIDEPRLGWHRHTARLSQLFVAGRNAEQTLSGLLEHKYRLSAVQAQRSLVYQGHNARLRTLLHHLNRKKSIRITVVGGGASCGVGATDPTASWVHVLNKTLSHAFPGVAVAADVHCTTSSASLEYAAMCKSSVLAQPQLDLVLLELNQQAIHPTDVKVAEPLVQYEQLIRVALNTSPPPAVVMLQVPGPGQMLAPGVEGHVPFHITMEDRVAALAQYYDLPWLSLRNALYPDAVCTQPPASQSVPAPPVVGEQQSLDLLHSWAAAGQPEGDMPQQQHTQGGGPAGHAGQHQLASPHRHHQGLSPKPAMVPELGLMGGGWAAVTTHGGHQLNDLGHWMVADMLVWLLHCTQLGLLLDPVTSWEEHLALQPLLPAMTPDLPPLAPGKC